MQENENILYNATGFRIKVVEGMGLKLKDVLITKNPYPTLPCQQKLCPMCKVTTFTTPANFTGKSIPCNTPSVGYRITSMVCRNNGQLATYEGESGRPIVKRGWNMCAN